MNTPVIVRLVRFIAISFLSAAATAQATLWHVDLKGPNGDGKSAETALTSIQRAVDLAEPGDTVLIRPGIYYENVILKRGGTAKAPLRLMADAVERDRVILSGAARAIREGKVAWELVDKDSGLYRIPFLYRPTRVLASGVDLQPYPSLADLKAFRFLADNYPGNSHGFAWDPESKNLYVRLRADGRYGATNPNAAVMAVSGPPAGGKWGNEITADENWNLALRFAEEAHVIIDGLTFETPGYAGIYTEAGELTVRNCYFIGCRYGVAGKEPGRGGKGLIDRVTVENCYYTQYPAFTDVEDIVAKYKAEQYTKSEWWQKIMHWQRKGGLPPKSGGVGRAFNYETGLTRGMGAGWIVRYNYLYDVFEGFSAGSTSSSQGAEIYGNRLERICDNAVETENHSRDLRFHNNLIIDAFEPISWQPIDGPPMPGPAYIYDNIVLQTPAVSAMWEVAGNSGGIFKMGIQNRSGVGEVAESQVPGGFWVTHNTILVTRGRVFTLLTAPTSSYGQFYFANNVFLTRGIAGANSMNDKGRGIYFDGNLLAPSAMPTLPQESYLQRAALVAGPHGKVFDDPSVVTVAADGHVTMKEMEALNVGITTRTVSWNGLNIEFPALMPLRTVVGAVPFDNSRVGPQPRK